MNNTSAKNLNMNKHILILIYLIIYLAALVGNMFFLDFGDLMHSINQSAMAVVFYLASKDDIKDGHPIAITLQVILAIGAIVSFIFYFS